MTSLTKTFDNLNHCRASYRSAHELMDLNEKTMSHKKKMALRDIAKCVVKIDRVLRRPSNQLFREFINNLREHSSKFHWEFKRVHDEIVTHNDVICYRFYDPKSMISVSINGRVLFNEFSGISGLIEKKGGAMMPLSSNEINELLDLFESILEIRRK